MPLINLILTWSAEFVISGATVATKFVITDRKLYVPFVTLPTQKLCKIARTIIIRT